MLVQGVVPAVEHHVIPQVNEKCVGFKRCVGFVQDISFDGLSRCRLTSVFGHSLIAQLCFDSVKEIDSLAG